MLIPHGMLVMAALFSSDPQSVASAPAAGPATGFLYKTLELEGETYAYSIFVPPSYTPGRAWPLILFLHGAGERGSDGFRQTAVGIGTALRANHARIPALVVMPQCRPQQSWTGVMARMAVRCVEQTARAYAVDQQRLYLTGLSLGGQGTWLLGAEFPDKFAAIVPICGFVDYQEAGAGARIAARLKSMPTWVFHGAADKAVPVEHSRQMVAELRKLAAPVFYTEYPGVEHNSWDRAYGDLGLWKWLFEQRRR